MDFAPEDGSRASREPIVCQLVPVRPPEHNLNKRTPVEPPLVLDIGTNGAVRLTDPDTKALVASTWLAEVAAAPALYSYADENNPSYTQPLLIVDLPGSKPLRIGARPMGAGFRGIPQYRYGWTGSVHASDWISYLILSLFARLRGGPTVRGAKQPTHVVDETEWLTLVQTFGLTSRIVDENASGQMARRDGLRRVKSYLYLAVTVAVVAVAVYMHFAK